ncbi:MULTISPECIES: hypothetical protein [unclassified Mesorhizobium]|uniref:hypothetical protein n=1 Tax=unclassified Mesorhizobium TaxID=325217 RepID=UPI0003CEB19F|nr:MULTISPECIES: hypothetical protein [unclassified Mesorhizobium]ESY51702.1 hypothetical protein X745_22415 [Mesorhizobium sp. LNJC374B00]ESY58754.1 hypothetical protein X744_16930 [Mesorhizobium sp. LNJC372A00]WJI78956.1 hypothetical protein NLY34_18955 [Mesorhizobium sp. C374B]WJI85490.1 hypothetical protein NLY42_21355 [Mesorhizobium sp. C372A]
MVDEPKTSTPESMVQTAPASTRSYDEMNTHQMIFEMQGTLGEIREAIRSLEKGAQRAISRVEDNEKATAELKSQITALTPKVEDVLAFIRHGMPSLVNKADLAALKIDIEKRPTRRQAILDIAWVVGLVSTILAIGARLAH